LQQSKFLKKSNPLFDELIVIDDPTPRPGPLNMAIDEVLLSSGRSAILRFYRWNQPTISFGFFVPFAEACGAAGDRVMVRRWTGGGIVTHGEDLTYSIMIGSNNGAFSLPSKIVYQRVHAALSSALHEIGIATALTEANEPKLSEACFANPVVSDVIENGRKIAGAAQRKTRSGLLHQGSIQRENLNGKFRRIFGNLLAKRLVINSIEMDILNGAAELAVAKYATDAWLRRR
jgi:lipoate-protein ligase A